MAVQLTAVQAVHTQRVHTATAAEIASAATAPVDYIARTVLPITDTAQEVQAILPERGVRPAAGREDADGVTAPEGYSIPIYKRGEQLWKHYYLPE